MNDSEEAVRRLFGVTMEDAPPGVDLVRGVRARIRGRVVRARALSAAGLAGVVAVAATTALSVGQVSSALAQVTQAASRTAAQSYRVAISMFAYITVPGSPRTQLPVTALSGEFDPARGTGEEWSPGSVQIRCVGRYMYLPVSRALLHLLDTNLELPVPAGKTWLRAPAPWLSGSVTPESLGMLGAGLVSPHGLLADLTSVGQAREAGPAAGPGWTGTAYTFSTDPGTWQRIVLGNSGTVDVDQQGRIRRADAIGAIQPSASVSYPAAGTPPGELVHTKVELTFGNFGAVVRVSAPPARETFTVPPSGLAAIYQAT